MNSRRGGHTDFLTRLARHQRRGVAFPDGDEQAAGKKEKVRSRKGARFIMVFLFSGSAGLR